MQRFAVGMSVFALAAAVAGAAYLIFADSYSSESCSMTAGSDVMTCAVSDGSTLIEESGRWVLWLLAVPVVATAIVVAVIVGGLPAWPGWVVAVFLLCASILTSLTIGAFFLPAALLAVGSMWMYSRAVSQASPPGG